jgi:uncharacterized membrane protein YbhN (UPF0104 family)
VLTTAYAAESTQAAAITLLDRVISVLSIIVFGGIAYILSSKTKARPVEAPAST